MEFYLTTKNKISSSTGKWMELEGIVLSEISQAQAKSHMFSILCRLWPNTNETILWNTGHTKGRLKRKPKTWMRLMCSLYRNEYRNLKLTGATKASGIGRNEEDWRSKLIRAIIHICMGTTQGNSLCSCLYR
jgi:hypothetical protein